MEPMGKIAYELAVSNIEKRRQEAERERLIAELDRGRPGPLDRACVSAGDRMVWLGERLRQRGEQQWRTEESPAAGM